MDGCVYVLYATCTISRDGHRIQKKRKRFFPIRRRMKKKGDNLSVKNQKHVVKLDGVVFGPSCYFIGLLRLRVPWFCSPSSRAIDALDTPSMICSVPNAVFLISFCLSSNSTPYKIVLEYIYVRVLVWGYYALSFAFFLLPLFLNFSFLSFSFLFISHFLLFILFPLFQL